MFVIFLRFNPIPKEHSSRYVGAGAILGRHRRHDSLVCCVGNALPFWHFMACPGMRASVVTKIMAINQTPTWIGHSGSKIKSWLAHTLSDGMISFSDRVVQRVTLTLISKGGKGPKKWKSANPSKDWPRRYLDYRLGALILMIALEFRP